MLDPISLLLGFAIGAIIAIIGEVGWAEALEQFFDIKKDRTGSHR